jgi:hypothetical protein
MPTGNLTIRFAVLLGSASLFLAGCGAAPPAAEAVASAKAPEPDTPPAPPTPEPVETGRDCAKASALCEGDGCTLELDNQCDAPLTCDAFIMLRCQTNTEIVEARGRGRQTFPSKAKQELVVRSNCTMGALVGTYFSELKCQ